jgi:hypothetical protein
VGVFKYTAQPTIEIDPSNSGSVVLTGTYTNEADPTEKVEKYKFDIYKDNNDTPVETTGWKNHKNENDGDSMSIDEYIPRIDITLAHTFKVIYTV